MLRTALLCLATLAAVTVEFAVYPGHSYLAGDSQLYVPMIERVDAPGLLARDLVATNPNLSFTAYDEITVFLHQSWRLSFRQALLGQLFLCRLAAFFGVFLLARTTGLNQRFSFLAALIINLGFTLGGPAATFGEREPVPAAFAISLALLAMGLLAMEKPLLGGLIGGLALLYDPVMALPFWICLLAGAGFETRLRPFIRPMAPILLIFGLLLANLAQLQPAGGGETALRRITEELILFQDVHARYLRVADWSSKGLLEILMICGLGAWAAVRVWNLLNEFFRWLVLGTAVCGLISLVVTVVLVDGARLLTVERARPARMLLYTGICGALLFALAGMKAVLRRRNLEAVAWFVLLFAMPLTSVFSAQFVQEKGRAVSELAEWADAKTWGGAIFHFPGAGREMYPGVFRAESRRGLWADWKGAEAVAFAPGGAAEWQQRWDSGEQRIERTLSQQVDYYVFEKPARISGVRSVFENNAFAVYDAQDLREARKPIMAIR